LDHVELQVLVIASQVCLGISGLTTTGPLPCAGVERVEYMLRHLSTLPWERVDCLTAPVPTAHGAIVGRDMPKNPRGSDVVLHVVRHMAL
jgi:hypothetical protein